MRKTISIVVAMTLLSSAAGAVCGVPQPRLVCQEYFAESAVVMAKLVRVRSVGPVRPGQMDGHYYHLEVDEWLRGRTTKRLQVYEENTVGRAPFEWKRGESYLLFLSYAKEDRGWELDGCGNSAPLASAKKVLREIEEIKAGKSHEFIQGYIASTETLPRVTIKAEGGGTTRTAVTDNREFSIRVAPGAYVVSPNRPGWQFEADTFSYSDPRKIRIEKGGCAQVQFQASRAAAAK